MKQTILVKSVDDSGTSTASNTGFDLEAFKKKYGVQTSAAGSGTNGSGAFDLEAFRQKYSAIGKSNQIAEDDLVVLEANRSGGDRYANNNGAGGSYGSTQLSGTFAEDTPVVIKGDDYSSLSMAQKRADAQTGGNRVSDKTVTRETIDAAKANAEAARKNAATAGQMYQADSKEYKLADATARQAQADYEEQKAAYNSAQTGDSYKSGFGDVLKDTGRTIAGGAQGAGAALTDAVRNFLAVGSNRPSQQMLGGADADQFAQYLNKTRISKLENKADTQQTKSEANLNAAKSGRGTVGNVLVDVGANLTQMGIDGVAGAALTAATGIPLNMLPFVLRAYGGGTLEARQNGGTVEQQAAYGLVSAAREYLTEKIANVAVPFKKAYGGGALDEFIDGVIAKATQKLASSAMGQKLIGGALKVSANALGEALEEATADWFDWLFHTKEIYGGERGTAQETFQDSLYDALIGGLAGLVGSAVSVDTYKYNADSVLLDLANKKQQKFEAGLAEWKQKNKSQYEKTTGRTVQDDKAQGNTDAADRVKAQIQAAQENPSQAAQEAIQRLAEQADTITARLKELQQNGAQAADTRLTLPTAETGAQAQTEQTAQRLIRLGLNEETAAKLASAVSMVLNGETPSRTQIDAIWQTPEAAQLVTQDTGVTIRDDTASKMRANVKAAANKQAGILTLPTGEEGRTAQNVAAKATQQNAAEAQQNAENAAPAQTRVAAAEQAAYTGTDNVIRNAVQRLGESPAAAQVREVYNDTAAVNALQQQGYLSAQQAQVRDAGAMWNALNNWKERTNYGEQGRIYGNGSGLQRNDAYDSRQPAGRVYEGTAAVEGNRRGSEEAGGSAVGSQRSVQKSEAGKVGSFEADSVIPEAASKQRVEVDAETTTESKKADAIAKRNGAKRTRIKGGIRLKNGTIARGAYSAVTDSILTQTDSNTATEEQITAHEVMHRLISHGKAAIKSVLDRATSYTNNENIAFAVTYYETYYGNLGAEELLCDSAGLINQVQMQVYSGISSVTQEEADIVTEVLQAIHDAENDLLDGAFEAVTEEELAALETETRQETETNSENSGEQSEKITLAAYTVSDSVKSDKAAADFLKKYQSAADTESVSNAIEELRDYIRAYPNDKKTIESKAKEIARSIISETREAVDTDNQGIKREIRKYLRSVKIKYGEGKTNIADYNEWKNRNFGNFTISKNGTPINEIWDNLNEMFGEGFFPSSIINQTDMMEHLDKLLNDGVKFENPFAAVMDDASAYVGAELLDMLSGKNTDGRTKFSTMIGESSLLRKVENGEALTPKEETQFSTEMDEKFMENAISVNNEGLKKGKRTVETGGKVDTDVMEQAKIDRAEIKKALQNPEIAKYLPEDKMGDTFFSDSSYGGSQENQPVCVRSIAVDALMDNIAKELGRPLTVEETIWISQSVFELTDKPECVYCYVAMDRKAYRQFLGDYLKARDGVTEEFEKGSDSGSIYQKFLNGRSNTDNMQYRFNLWQRISEADRIKPSDLAEIEKLIREHDELQSKIIQHISEIRGIDTSKIVIGTESKKALLGPQVRVGTKTKKKSLMPLTDLMSDTVIGKDATRFVQLYDAMQYAQSASWAKKRSSYVAYNGHILNWTKERVDKLNAGYGVRFYSFNDFSPAFILENMQMITDASVRGLKGLAYTKELDFVRIFAKTGLSINVSVFGYENPGKTYRDNDFMACDGMQGADWTEAQKLRDQYKNVGCTFVAMSDEQVRWALRQPWIDVVIPFHTVRTGTVVAEYFGWKNYKDMQGDVKGEGWVEGKHAASIKPPAHQNNLEMYLAALEENHLTPRFAEYLNDPETRPYYMKLVNETRLSEGESKALQPVFNVGEAKRSIEDIKLWGNYYQPIFRDTDTQQQVAEEMADSIREGRMDGKLKNGTMFSTEMDTRYMELAKDPEGNREELQRMVEEAAKKAGYNYKVYHGTQVQTKTGKFPFTVFKGGVLGAIYTATNRSLAEDFSRGFNIKGTVYDLYAKLDNPLVVNEHIYSEVPWYANVPVPSVMKNEKAYKYFDKKTGRAATEEIAVYAHDNGYDGAVIEGIREGSGTQTDDIIVFDSNLLKSADPVTYDDNGNIIPLSQRFDSSKDDIRYSTEMEYLRESDTQDYLKAGSGNNKNKLAAYNNGEQVVLKDRDSAKSYIESAIKGKSLATAAFSKVNDRLRDDIFEASGGKVDVSGYYLELVASDLKHAFDEHAIAKERDDIDLSKPLFYDIPSIIYNYGELLDVTKYDSGKTVVRLITPISGGSAVVIEVVSKSRKSLQFKTMYGSTNEKISRIKKETKRIPGGTNVPYTPHGAIVSEQNVSQYPTKGNSGKEQNSNFSTEMIPNERTEAALKELRERIRGKKISRVRSNAYEAGGLYTEVEAQMAGNRMEDFTYDPVSETQSMNRAKARLDNDFDGEAERLSRADAWSSEDLDTAMGILHAYRQQARLSGDYSQFTQWSHMIQQKGTMGGQMIQAFAKYSRTATGAAQKAVANMKENAGKLNPKQEQTSQKASEQVETEVNAASQEAAENTMDTVRKGKPRKRKTFPDSQKTRDALHIIEQIYDIFSEKQKPQHGEPVENWNKKTGEKLANRLSRRVETPRSKSQTMMQVILDDLVRFAEEHALPDRPSTVKRTAVQRITDYINNRSAYQEAWMSAKDTLRAMYKDDSETLDMFETFLNGTIGYNADEGHFDSTMFAAIMEVSETLGIDEKRIRDLAAVGAKDYAIRRITAAFIDAVKLETGETDVDYTDSLRDAVKRHINGVAMAEENNGRLRLERLISEADRKLDIQIQKLLTESKRTKQDAAYRVAQYLVEKFGITESDASIAADYIADCYMDELEVRCNNRLQRMFSENDVMTKNERDKLLELFRLGGFSNQSVRDNVVDALGFGDVTRAKQSEILENLARFADTLDSMNDGDVEGLRALIREQAAVRNTRLSKGTEKLLDGETSFEYLHDFAMSQLDSIAADYNQRNFGSKLSTYQTMSHLINARTAMRNVASNQVFDLVATAANDVSLLPDIILSRITGQRTVGVQKSWASKAKRQGAVKGAKRNALEVALDVDIQGRNKSKYGTSGRRTWGMANSNTAGRFMSRAEQLMGYELNTTDEFHKGSVRAETLESLSRWVKAGYMTMEEAQQFAEEEALFRSFQDDTMVGSMLATLKDAGNMIGIGDSSRKTSKGKTIHSFGVGDLLVKYTQVPGALIHRAIEFSPTGYVKALASLAKMTKAYKAGESTTALQRRTALAFGQATTGTGLILLFAALAKAGLLRRDDDEEDKNAKAMKTSQGLSGTQFNLTGALRWASGGSPELQDGDVMADIGFLEPLDSLMTIAALVANEDDANAGDLAVDSLEGVWMALSDTTAMQTISNLIQTVQYHNESDGTIKLIGELAIEFASSNITGFVPSPVRQIAQATDTTYRDQYRTQNLFEQTGAKLASTIPGIRQQLAPKKTPLGEDKTYQKPLLNALNATLNPGNINVYESSSVVDELDRVYAETGDAKIWPERNAPYSTTIKSQKYTLTGDERTAWQTERGQLTATLIDEMSSTNWYKELESDRQAELLGWIGNFANATATASFAEGRGIEYESSTYGKYMAAYDEGGMTRLFAYLRYKIMSEGVTKQEDKIALIRSLNLSDEDSCALYRSQYDSDKNNPWAEPGNLLSASSGLLLPSE